MARRLCFPWLIGLALAAAVPASAQSLGTFRWQLQPFCNIVTFTVTQTGGLYRLEGMDDQCGTQPASALGTAFLNPDGTIGVGFTVVSTPGGAPVRLEAAIGSSTFNGTWRDGLGYSGTFVFTPGGGVGGPPKPALPVGMPVTTAAIGPGLSGTTATGTLTLAVDFGGSGTAPEVARSDHTHAVPPSGNTALGDQALAAMRTMPSAPSGNTGIGSQALRSTTAGIHNTAVGTDALRDNVSGSYNVAIGLAAMLNSSVGSDNTAIGALALLGGGSGNVAIGSGALRGITTGASNVAIGGRALDTLTTGSGNIGIGALAGAQAGPGQVDNIFIANGGQGQENFTIRIGTPSTHGATFIAGIAGRVTTGDLPVLINASGKLGTTTSSARFKERIRDLSDQDARLAALSPVRFTYRPEFGGDGREVQYGLLAEEVASIFPELVARDEQGQPWAVRSHLLPSLILGSTQRLERRGRVLEDRLRWLEAQLDALEQADAVRPGKEPRQ